VNYRLKAAMRKALFRIGSGGRQSIGSLTDEFPLKRFRKLRNAFLTWAPLHLVGSNVFFDSKSNSLKALREQVSRLEGQLLLTKAALAIAQRELLDARRQTQHFRSQSLHDSLTKLPNRLSIQSYLDVFLQDYAKTDFKLAVLFIDIDKFKMVNDIHGHAIGDEVLQIIAARIRGAVRSNDRLGRLGGDEFICLIANAKSRENIARVADQICNVVRKPIQIGDIKLVVGASVGIAFSPEHGIDSESLIKKADIAMYRAKRQGDTFSIFDPSTDL
jgi:diguanylate cyclase